MRICFVGLSFKLRMVNIRLAILFYDANNLDGHSPCTLPSVVLILAARQPLCSNGLDGISQSLRIHPPASFVVSQYCCCTTLKLHGFVPSYFIEYKCFVRDRAVGNLKHIKKGRSCISSVLIRIARINTERYSPLQSGRLVSSY